MTTESLDPSIPFVVSQPISLAISQVQRYGFFVLVLSVVGYVAYRYYSSWNSHKQIYDPSRVSRLTEQTRERRLAQQTAWADQASQVIASEEKKQKPPTKQDRLYREKQSRTDDNDDDDDWYRKKDKRGPSLSAWDAAGGPSKGLGSNIRGVMRPGPACSSGS